MILTCFCCQKDFERQTKYVNAAKKKGQEKFFCSIKCHNTYQNKKRIKLIELTKNCPICGKEFTTKNGTKEQTYCSVQCGNSVKKGMLNKKSSKVWSTPLEEFKDIVLSSYSIAEILRKIGYKSKGKFARDNVRYRILKENIPHPNIVEAMRPKYDLESIIRNKVPYNNNLVMKNRLINTFHFEYACAKCGNAGFHNGGEITLALHHIDGNSFNNAINNLELLCPNCHSQTMNYCRRKISDRKKPTSNELESLILSYPLVHIAKTYSVSDNSVRKWLMSYRLPFTREGIAAYKDSIRLKNSLIDDSKKNIESEQ